MEQHSSFRTISTVILRLGYILAGLSLVTGLILLLDAKDVWMLYLSGTIGSTIFWLLVAAYGHFLNMAIDMEGNQRRMIELLEKMEQGKNKDA